MPIGKLIGAGIKAKRAYDESKKTPPSPKVAAVAPKTIAAPSTRQKANMAADFLNVPGRDVVRGSMARRKKQLDDI